MQKSVLILFIVIASIAKQSQAQIITTVAGNGAQGYSGDGGQATNAELTPPNGIAFDGLGNYYYSDDYGNCVRKISTSGIITTVAGDTTQGYSGDGGQATNAQLYQPFGLAIDMSGNLYIADQYNNVIRMVNTLGIISTIAGRDSSGIGVAGFSGDGGPATAAELMQPLGLTIDASGNLYIADMGNNVVRMINTAGIINTIAGGGSCGTPYCGDGGSATAAELSVTGIAFDAVGNLYIADAGNNIIRKVNTLGVISTVVGNTINYYTGGNQGYSGDGGQATAAALNSPNDVALDYKGNLYIADANNNAIRMVNTLGVITTIAGNGSQGFIGDGGLSTAAELYSPYEIALDASGNLYIADWGNSRIRKVDTSKCISTSPIVSFTLTPDTMPHTWDAYPIYSAYTDSVRWYWGDGTDTLALYPSHTYSVAGRYNICVTAYSSCGDSAQSCQNDTVYRTTNSSMVYINVDSSSAHTTNLSHISGLNTQVSLYPNPNNGTFTLQLNEYENTSVEVYNIIGECVYRQPATSSNSQINITDLSNGMYQLRVLKNNNLIYQSKVVKQD